MHGAAHLHRARSGSPDRPPGCRSAADGGWRSERGTGAYAGAGEAEPRGFRSWEWRGWGSEVEEGLCRDCVLGCGERRGCPHPHPRFFSPHPLTVEELRLDMEELLLSMRPNEGSGPRGLSPFSSISDAAWVSGREVTK